MTRTLLLIVTPERKSTESFHWCLHTAKETKRFLRVVSILEASANDRDQKLLAEIERQCRTFQVPFEAKILSGDYFELCRELANQKDVDILVVTEKKRSLLKKLFGDSEVKRLREQVFCEIKTYTK